MIKQSMNEASRAVVTSDQWHVVHARWERNLTKAARFTRTIVSEHSTRPNAVESARSLMHGLVAELAERPLPLRDQVFVRKPGYRSFKRAHRLVGKKT